MKKTELYLSENLVDRYTSKSHGGGHYCDRHCLPKINGNPVEGIWCPDEFSNDQRMLDAVGWKYSIKSSRYSWGKDDDNGDEQNPDLGFLIPDFKELFGWQTINGKRVFVQSVSFRTDASGNGSFMDSIMSVYCAGDNNLTFWHRNDVDDPEKSDKNQYVQRWFELFETDREYPPHPKTYFWQFDKTYTHIKEENGTWLQYVNGEVFPTTESVHWKKYGTHPVKPYDNGNRLKMFKEDENKIYLLNRINKVERGAGNLVIVRSPYGSSQWYRFPVCFNRDDSFVRVTIDTISKDGKYVGVGYGDIVRKDGKFSNDKRFDVHVNDLYAIFAVFDVTEIKRIKNGFYLDPENGVSVQTFG